MSPVPVSGEVGNVDSSTVVVTWDSNVTASDYTLGCLVTVNSSMNTIASATRQLDHHVVYYALTSPVMHGDVAQFSYDSEIGNYTN